MNSWFIADQTKLPVSKNVPDAPWTSIKDRLNILKFDALLIGSIWPAAAECDLQLSFDSPAQVGFITLT